MMALFMVLWLVSSSEQVKKAIGGYFNDPTGKGKEVGNGLRGAGGESLSLQKDDMGKLKEKLEQAIKTSQPFQKMKEHVVMTVTGEGLRSGAARRRERYVLSIRRVPSLPTTARN